MLGRDDKDTVSFLLWNANGLTPSKLRKLHSMFISFGIIFITESWFHIEKYFPFILPGFVCHNFCRRSVHRRAKRGSGGLVVFVRNSLVEFVEVAIRDDVEDRVWLSLSGPLLNSPKDVYLCLGYVAPQGSSVHAEKLWHTIEEEAAAFAKKGWIILTGDFNARTGNERDYVANDSDEYLSLPEDYSVDTTLPRFSQDTVTNQFGHYLLELCRGSGLRIINGRIGEDKEVGKYTCFTPRGCSVVDYVIAHEVMMSISLKPSKLVTPCRVQNYIRPSANFRALY